MSEIPVNPNLYNRKLTVEERVDRLPTEIREKFIEATNNLGELQKNQPLPNIKGPGSKSDVLYLVEQLYYMGDLSKKGEGHKDRDGNFRAEISDNRISEQSARLAASIFGYDYSLRVKDKYYLEHEFSAPPPSK